jgi:UDP-N-acetylmuramoyl-L-alanyl-D-glutamate--2,6-diaminopimelate ligase
MQIKDLLPQRIKNVYHLSQASLANLVYGFPSKNLKVIGITGTNGKTTTCQMIAKILEEAGHKVAMASTINFKLGEKEWVNKTKFTTLSSFQVQKFISDAKEAECAYLILEVSSHSLDQYRVAGIKFHTAVITNITREHLDYHKTMTEYRLAKIKLFEDTNVSIVNLDMEKPEEFLEFGKERYGYSTQIEKHRAQKHVSNVQCIIAENIALSSGKTTYEVKNIGFDLNLPGIFNVENALAATCVGVSENIDLKTIKIALEKIKGVPGRLEHVANNKNIEVIVDYAVTPDSLKKLFGHISKMKNNSAKIISVFGACGERDRGKRPIMGKIVGERADFVIVTNEDPYREDPEQIINEVFSGVVSINGDKNRNSHKEEKINCWRIMDRRVAIKKALTLARPGDIVVVTGKGAEETMAIGKKIIPWNDKKIILEELKNI